MATNQQTKKSEVFDQSTTSLPVRVSDEEALLEWDPHSDESTHLVVAPVRQHLQNVQERLRKERDGDDAYEFLDLEEISARILGAVEEETNSIDRIDRLALLKRVVTTVEDEALKTPALAKSFAGNKHESIEQNRSDVEALTNFHPERITAFRETADEQASPIDADGKEWLNATVSVEQTLRQYTSKAVSDVELIRRATRRIRNTKGKVWEKAFPNIEQISLVGVSGVSAAQIDLLRTLHELTAVKACVICRRGTGPYLQHRIPRLGVAEPGAVIFRE